ncbi:MULTISPECIES: RDD family protein [Flavobacterium]|uniref:RDD family protein n=1 Tax=Flavobacterium anhuiense TaxID=459526 RepID=A0AAC9GH98_9FLAO|nr:MULTISPECIES: RDD family protein [Flavobacterium]AOC94255.1 RDD family protein [Flavobacterium anhuiense]EJG00817.1 RDD domain-containing protein [Flavobacterium sp. F52]
MSNSTYILDDKLLASSGARFLNYILDLLFFFIVFMMIIFFLGILIGLGFTDLGIWMDNLGDFGWNIIAIVISLTYYLVMEGLFARSIAKFITGTVVVDENGQKPDFATIFKRSLCRFIPFDALTFLGGSRGWHDSLSHTYVVNKKALEEEMRMFQEFNLIGINEVI